MRVAGRRVVARRRTASRTSGDGGDGEDRAQRPRRADRSRRRCKAWNLQTFIDEALDGFSLPERNAPRDRRCRRRQPVLHRGTAQERRRAHSGARDRQGKRDVPQNVRTTLLERLRPFDEDERRVVTQAAVIGRTFGLAAAGRDAANPSGRLCCPTLRRARDFQLVEEVSPAVFRFRHGLDARRDLRRTISARSCSRAITRSRAHGIRASRRALARSAGVSLVGGRDDAVHAARYNEMAGDAAANVHAHQDAIAFYERALECDVEPVVRGSIMRKIADRRLALGWTKEAQATYSAAADIFRRCGRTRTRSELPRHRRHHRVRDRAARPDRTARSDAVAARRKPNIWRGLASISASRGWRRRSAFPTRGCASTRAGRPAGLGQHRTSRCGSTTSPRSSR